MKRALLLALALLITCVTTGSADTEAGRYCNASSIVTPGHDIRVWCWTYYSGNANYRADLVHVSVEDALASMRNPSAAPTAGPGDVISSVRLEGAEGHEVTGVVAPTVPGAYAIRVYHDNELVRVLISTVSRFGLVTIASPNMGLYAPVDLTTLALLHEPLSVSSASISGVKTLQAASDGLYVNPAIVDPHTADRTAKVYASAADGSVAFAMGNQYWGAGNQRTIFAQTDRPVYRPGDNVNMRAILRDGDMDSYHVVRKALTIEFKRSYPDRLLARRELAPDEFGAVSATATLPADAELGSYQVMIDDQQVASFDVQAYKKPEYTLTITPSKPYTIAGDEAVFHIHLAYLFGATAANFNLHYYGSLYYHSGDYFGPFSSGYRTEYQNVQGDATTDANGDATVRVPTKRLGLDGDLSVGFNARDESGRTITGNGTETVVRGTFHTLITPKSWIGEINESSTVDVKTLNHEGQVRPLLPLHVRIVKATWKNDKYDEQLFNEFDIRTNDRGVTSFAYTPVSPGEYRFEVVGRDERGDTIASSQWQWVVDPKSSWAPHLDRAELVPAKSVFNPGDPIRATLALTKPASDVIVTLSSDHLLEHRVVHMDGLTAQLEFPPVRHGEQILQVQACVPDERGLSCASTGIAVAPSTVLKVAVATGKARYSPGERAHFKLHVTEMNGRPVRAQIGIAIVDEGIYAIANEQNVDPNSTFYTRSSYVWAQANWFQPNNDPHPGLKQIARVSSGSAAAEGDLVKAGVGSDVYNVNATPAATPAPMANIALRRKFADTAYWTPSVVSDAHGDADVSFVWPENLTTWRATAIAATVNTHFGTQHASVIVTKSLLARLELPRFLRAGDEAVVTGIVHGDKVGDRIRMQLDPGPLGTPEPPVAVVLDRSRRASATWTLRNGYVGSVDPALRATNEKESDGMQLTLPLLGATSIEHVRSAGNLESSAEIPLTLGAGEMASALHLSFAPSMIAQLSQTLRAFDVYPYYCTEQTSSNGIVAAALLIADAKAKLPLANAPKVVIERALTKLMQLEHADQAYGWWERDSDSLFMTGYALYAKYVMTAAEGGAWNQDYRGSTAGQLAKMMAHRGQYDTDDDMALASYALSISAPKLLPADIFEAQVRQLGKSDAVTTAYIGLAAVALKRTDVAEQAAQALLRTSVSSNGGRFWKNNEWSWRWWSDPVAATALGAKLLYRTGHETQAQEALSFLRAERNGDWWYTTLDTATAAMTFAQIEGPDGAATPDETARVLVDGKVVSTVRVNSLFPDANATHVVLSADVMRHAHSVIIERDGTGKLYWSSDLEKYADVRAASVRDASEGVLTRLFAAPPALSVSRRFSVGHPGPWHVGDDVTCELWITARDGAEYVTLEDPYPAGTEYQLPQGMSSLWSWSGDQFLDDHAAFFFRQLWAGSTVHLTYHLRATTAGSFAAPGPSAFASYGPPVAAVGTGERVTITP